MFNLSIREMIRGYKEKEFSPREMTKAYLERMDQHADLNAYITINREKALQQAEIAELKYKANETTGILEGIPISIKDNLYTKGIRTTSGSKIDEKFIPDDDAGIVSKLQHEGAVNLGKVNMHEYAFGITSNNPFYGAVKNPWNKEHTPGGSSGGSGAAVAASLCAASIGTDTAGSIRIPAASCGVIGLKPTHGLVDSTGLKHISWTLDHVGPLAKNVDDLAILMEAMTNQDFTHSLNEDIRGMRIGVPANYFTEALNQGARELYEQSLKNFEHLGGILIDIDIPFFPEDLDLSFAIGISEAGYVHEQSLLNALDDFGPDVRASLQTSHNIPALDYIKALRRRAELKEQFEQLFENVDIIVTPVMPDTAQKIGQETMVVDGETDSTFMAMIRMPAVFNLTGQPAISIPCGQAENGLPMGIQLAGAAYTEHKLIKAAYAYEQEYLIEFYKARNEMSISL